MQVFLTGGTGFIGQALTRVLLRRGWSVSVLVRNPGSPQAQTLRNMGAQLAKGDVSERASMHAAMRGAELVINNAGHYEYGLDVAGVEKMQAVNVDGTENVLSLAQELGIPRVMHVSTVQAFGQTGTQPRDETYTRQAACKTSYEQSKTDAHVIALGYQQRGLPLVIVCPNAVIGVNDYSSFGYFARMYVNHVMPPMAWSPNSIFCCVGVEDLAEGLALAAEKGKTGEMYFFCGESQTFREIFGLWKKQPGGFAPKIWLPVGLAAILFGPLEALQRRLGLPALLSREIVRASAESWNYSSAKAKRELGWSHCSAEELWSKTIEAEIGLLARRKGQSLLQRLKPLDSLE
jgi:nucleoside-diphosphate-sugar epimerase